MNFLEDFVLYIAKGLVMQFGKQLDEAIGYAKGPKDMFPSRK